MNTYNIFDQKEPSTILYHAIAESEEQVKQLAKEGNINIEGLTIEQERSNVKDLMGKPYQPSIKSALVH